MSFLMVDPQQILEVLDTRLNLDDLNTDALGKHALENPSYVDSKIILRPSFSLQPDPGKEQ
jgi:hypothetical protein